jgi:Uncharacterised nucleotidyltransferase
MNPIKGELDPEEKVAFELARHWREPDYRLHVGKIDWSRLANILIKNRMSVLAMQVFDRANITNSIPSNAAEKILAQCATYQRASMDLGIALKTYLANAAAQRIPTIVLKGLWLCEKIYHVPGMRPGSDIDILVPRNQVNACLAALKEQNVGEYWANLLRDDYFSRHHLHQQRSSPDLKVWFEIHWALDHPYTLLTIDYEGIFERARGAKLFGTPVREMANPDLLLSLAVHIVKHAVYLPSLIGREDLPRIILADGMLMYYLDVAEVLLQFKDKIDWDLAVQLAYQWGAVEILGSVLMVCNRCLEAPVPEQVLAMLPVKGPGSATRIFMARAAEQQLAIYEGRQGRRFWKLLLAPNSAFILRPVRLLETAAYFFPPADFLRRRYGSASFVTGFFHLVRAAAQSFRFTWDTLYFGTERYLRLKRMGKNTSMFNKLETPL